jgi:hypothetical protein
LVKAFPVLTANKDAVKSGDMHFTYSLIQSDLLEQLGLSTLLKGTSTDASPNWLGDSNQQRFSYWPNALNR